MADTDDTETLGEIADAAMQERRGHAPGSLAALRENAIKPGETRNPKGTNGWRKAQAKIAEFMAEVAQPGKGNETRFQRVLQATYASALQPGPKGAPDRKILIEQVAGKAKQQVELSGQDGSPLRVVAMLPDNGRGPGDPDQEEDDDGQAGDGQK